MFLILAACISVHQTEAPSPLPEVACFEEKPVTRIEQTLDGWKLQLRAIDTPQKMISALQAPDVQTKLPDGSLAYTYKMGRSTQTRVALKLNSLSSFSSSSLAQTDYLPGWTSGTGSQSGAVSGAVSTTETVACTSTLTYSKSGRLVDVAASGDGCLGPEEVTGTRRIKTNSVECVLATPRDLACSELEEIRAVEDCPILNQFGVQTGYLVDAGAIFKTYQPSCSSKSTFRRTFRGWIYVEAMKGTVVGFVQSRCFEWARELKDE